MVSGSSVAPHVFASASRERGLLVEQLLRAVAQPARLEQRDERARRAAGRAAGARRRRATAATTPCRRRSGPRRGAPTARSPTAASRAARRRAPRTSSVGEQLARREDRTRRRRRRSSAGRRPRTATAGRPRRPTGRCAPDGRRSTGTRRRSSRAPRPRRAPPPGTRAGSPSATSRATSSSRSSWSPARDDHRLDRPRRAGRAAARARAPARPRPPGAGRRPSRSRQITRRRRPIVSNAGDTRSNGSVSHAGNSSTASAPRNSRRSAREALGLGAGRHREHDRPARGRRARASRANSARAGSGTATGRAEPPVAARDDRDRRRAAWRARRGQECRSCGHARRRPGRRRDPGFERPDYLRAASASVVAVHRGVDAVGEDQLDRVGRLLDRDVDLLAVALARTGSSTWSAPCSFDAGLPTPMRTRRNASACRCDLIERSPLWPASPPPTFTRSTRGRQVELVVHDHELLGLDAVAAHERRDRLPGVVHVRERHRERRAACRRRAPRRRARAPCPCAAGAP